MKPVQLKKFKTLFEKEKGNLIFKSVVDKDFEVSQDDLMDEVDRTSVDLEQTVRIRLRNREALYLKKIESALKRINEGSFGTCMVCEEDIEEKRLMARPTTTHCIQCKEMEERNEKHFVDGRESMRIKRALIQIA